MKVVLKLGIWCLGLTLLFSSCARPIAQFSYTPKDTKAPSEVTFQNQSQKAETYVWEFGDETSSEEENPKHRYKTSGNYEVTLKATKGKKTTILKQRLVVDAPQVCMVELQTEFGDMLIELYDSTPEHRDNFSKLVEEGFYDSLKFHRVIEGFMIQGGDPNSKEDNSTKALGSGDLGYTIPAEFVDSLVHLKGILAAARQPDVVNPTKASSACQFYIVDGTKISDAAFLDKMASSKGKRYTKAQKEAYLKFGGAPQLDWNYTIFGRVVKGLEVIDKIAAVKTGEQDRPLKYIRMKMVTIK